MSLVVFLFLVALTLIGHGYFWIGPVNRLHAWAGSRVLIDLLTHFCLAAFFVLPLWGAWDWWNRDSVVLYQYWKSAGFLPRYTQLCVLWGVGKIVYDWVDQRKVNSPKNLLRWRQRWAEFSSAGEAPLVYGFYPRLLAALPGNQILRLSIDEKRLAIPTLPDELVGLKIAHVSDLHMIGRIDRRWFEMVADEVNRLEADVILITGDIVEKVACLPWLAGSLGRLQAKHGVYFILGNHDFFIDAERTRQILVDAGLVCLSGKWHETEWNGARVLLSGNERPWGSDSLEETRPEVAAADRPFHLSLIHTPDQFRWACEHQANLVLAGHTHGGQIRFPILGAVACPSVHGTHFACGVFRSGNSVMHVTRGVSGETPFRFNCPPEIALLELA